jgi:hypothetical protein
MSSRILSLQRGKTGDVQRFSLARPIDPAKAALLQGTLTPGMSYVRRSQVLADPNTCSQFACRWGDSFGFFTRPTISDTVNDEEDQLVCGSFTDTIGQVYPVTVTHDKFLGFFTTLVRREDAALFHLAVYPKDPDTIKGPPTGAGVRAPPIEASNERLNWAGGEGEGSEAVIVALPNFLPVPPGCTFPHMEPLVSGTSLRDDFPLLEVWRGGVTYCRDNNSDTSVTLGGPMFHLPDLALGDEDDDPVDPFDPYPVLLDLVAGLTVVPPVSPVFTEVKNHLEEWSEQVWLDLGGRVVPDEPIHRVGETEARSTQSTKEIVAAISKEKDFRLFPRTSAKIRIFLAGNQPPTSDTPAIALLAMPKAEFTAYLRQPVAATASDDLKELIRTAIKEARASKFSLSKDVTLRPGTATLAFSDRWRTFDLLYERLFSVSLKHADSTIGLKQFLTPLIEALSLIEEGDSRVQALVRANVTNSSAQIEATKTSRMYSEGLLSTFRHVYEGVCNLRLVLGVMVHDVEASLLVQKLTAYTDLLMDEAGDTFWCVYKNNPFLAVHAFQDVQHIISAFANVAMDARLYKSVMDGGDVTLASFSTAVAVADGHIGNLRTVLCGNGLGTFRDAPHCAPWFRKVAPSPPVERTRGASGPGGSMEHTRGSSGPSDSGGAPKRQKLSPADFDRLKLLGVLKYDSSVPGAKTDFLDNPPVRYKKRGAKSAERLCMKFLTQGFVCPDEKTCRRPHVPNLNTLVEADRKKMLSFVSKAPGLSWAPGKEPAGTI